MTKKNKKEKVMENFENFESIDKYIASKTAEYKIQVDNTDSIEDLNKMEGELMVEMDSYGEYIKGVTYSIPDTVEFDGVEYSKDEVIDKLSNIITDQEIEWKYVKGIYELIQEWRSGKITYALVDTTLRMLSNGSRFRGMQMCIDANIINELISPTNSGYFKDAAGTIILHTNHNYILEKLDKLNEPPAATPGTMIIEEDCDCCDTTPVIPLGQ